MSGDENNVAGYLKKFIRSLELSGLSLFLNYYTGSYLMSVDNITVTFNSSDSSKFASIIMARCCSRELDLQSAYSSYMELKGTFNSILNNSNLWIM